MRGVWQGEGFAACAGPPEDAVVVESFLVVGGRVRGLHRHRSRLAQSCALSRLVVGEDRLGDFVAGAAAALPHAGRWFPRLEVHRGDPAQLVLWIRPAPDEQLSVRLWSRPPGDPRLLPRCKGPDLALLSQLREQARSRGADDALLRDCDGVVLEAAHSGLVWWRGGDLYYVDPDLPRLPSVTVDLLVESAIVDGQQPRPQRCQLADLVDVEVWAVNALYGIRPVSGWVRGEDDIVPCRAQPDRQRLDHFRSVLRALSHPVFPLEAAGGP